MMNMGEKMQQMVTNALVFNDGFFEEVIPTLYDEQSIDYFLNYQCGGSGQLRFIFLLNTAQAKTFSMYHFGLRFKSSVFLLDHEDGGQQRSSRGHSNKKQELLKT